MTSNQRGADYLKFHREAETDGAMLPLPPAGFETCWAIFIRQLRSHPEYRDDPNEHEKSVAATWFRWGWDFGRSA